MKWSWRPNAGHNDRAWRSPAWVTNVGDIVTQISESRSQRPRLAVTSLGRFLGTVAEMTVTTTALGGHQLGKPNTNPPKVNVTTTALGGHQLGWFFQSAAPFTTVTTTALGGHQLGTLYLMKMGYKKSQRPRLAVTSLGNCKLYEETRIRHNDRAWRSPAWAARISYEKGYMVTTTALGGHQLGGHRIDNTSATCVTTTALGGHQLGLGVVGNSNYNCHNDRAWRSPAWVENVSIPKEDSSQRPRLAVTSLGSSGRKNL